MTGGDGGTAEWPVELRGVTESVVATRGPEGRWNLAALGLRVRGDVAGDPGSSASAPDDPDARWVSARTWGRTRTRTNFERDGEGVVQFTRDPRTFVDAALGIVEREEPVVDGADARVRVTAERTATGVTDGTEWAGWRLTPVESEVHCRVVPAVNRGYNAVVEATVWASRLDVEGYDTEGLVDRIAFLSTVVESCGGPRDRAAFERIDDHVGWTDRR